MHLPPDQLIFGVAPALLIDCARQIHDWDIDGKGRAFGIEDFCEALGAPPSEAAAVLQAMLAEGFFSPVHGASGQYIATRKLGQLALASISHGISRGEANALVARVVEKADWVNAHPDKYDHRVACVVVFGSYLTDKPHLGDLDIGVALEKLSGHGLKYKGEATEAWIRRGVAARNRTLRALRLREPKKISVHELEEVIGLETPYELIFGALPDRQLTGSNRAPDTSFIRLPEPIADGRDPGRSKGKT